LRLAAQSRALARRGLVCACACAQANMQDIGAKDQAALRTAALPVTATSLARQHTPHAQPTTVRART